MPDDEKIKRRPGFKFVCEACCGEVRMTVLDYDGVSSIIIACPDHGASIVRDGTIERIEFK